MTPDVIECLSMLTRIFVSNEQRKNTVFLKDSEAKHAVKTIDRNRNAYHKNMQAMRGTIAIIII